MALPVLLWFAPFATDPQASFYIHMGAMCLLAGHYVMLFVISLTPGVTRLQASAMLQQSAMQVIVGFTLLFMHLVVVLLQDARQRAEHSSSEPLRKRDFLIGGLTSILFPFGFMWSVGRGQTAPTRCAALFVLVVILTICTGLTFVSEGLYQQMLPATILHWFLCVYIFCVLFIAVLFMYDALRSVRRNATASGPVSVVVLFVTSAVCPGVAPLCFALFTRMPAHLLAQAAALGTWPVPALGYYYYLPFATPYFASMMCVCLPFLLAAFLRMWARFCYPQPPQQQQFVQPTKSVLSDVRPLHCAAGGLSGLALVGILLPSLSYEWDLFLFIGVCLPTIGAQVYAVFYTNMGSDTFVTLYIAEFVMVLSFLWCLLLGSLRHYYQPIAAAGVDGEKLPLTAAGSAMIALTESS